MEFKGAVEIFSRSVEARNLIYKSNVGDGSTKLILQLGTACHTDSLFAL